MVASTEIRAQADALRTELVKQVPGFCIEVLEDDLLIRERCIVIGNLPEFPVLFVHSGFAAPRTF